MYVGMYNVAMMEDTNQAQQGGEQSKPPWLYGYINMHDMFFAMLFIRIGPWNGFVTSCIFITKCFPFLTHYIPSFVPSLFLYRRYLRNEMEDDWLKVDQSGNVSQYLSISERMVRDSINVHLVMMSAWCVRVCVYMCVCVCVCVCHQGQSFY